MAWRIIGPVDEDGEFVAQFDSETNELTNFWSTIRISPRIGMTDEEMLRLMLLTEEVWGQGDELN